MKQQAFNMKNQEVIFRNSEAENFTRELIKSGHNKAAASFSTLIGQSVYNTGFILQTSPNLIEVPGIRKGDGPLTLVTSEIMGEVKGKSYLILNETECDRIYNICLMEESHGRLGLLRGELFKELGNILSAAVITEFSNRLELNIYGNVPRIFLTEANSIQTMLQDDLNEDFLSDSYVVTDMNFVLEGYKNCRPQLIWKLAEPFYYLVHQQAAKANGTRKKIIKY